MFPGEHICTEIHFIRHAESSMNVNPDLIGGRSPSVTLTGLGKRQARALGVHLRSTGVEFDAVYSSPLERAMQTAYAVCQVMKHCKNLTYILFFILFCLLLLPIGSGSIPYFTVSDNTFCQKLCFLFPFPGNSLSITFL